jgi:hypothetical protein
MYNLRDSETIDKFDAIGMFNERKDIRKLP